MPEKYRKTLVVIIGLFCCVCFSAKAQAFSFSSLFDVFKSKPVKPHVIIHAKKDEKQPAKMKVGVYVLHVGKFDLQSATTRMDFYLIFKCKPVCSDLNFEIMNATNVTTHLVAKQKDSLIYRTQADISKADNLRNYPFDSHSLDIILENRQLTSNKMVFEADASTTGFDNGLKVVGFELSPTWTATVFEHYYGVFQQTFSSYKFSMYISRPILAGILKGILPALIIVCCNFLALFMEIDKASQRLGIATSTLIASEVFHLNLTASVPPLGYITYADMFMFINYIYLFIVLIEVVLTTYYVETKHHELAERINTICAWVIPILWISLQAFNWYVFDPTNIFGNAIA